MLNIKKILAAVLSIILLLAIAFYSYQLSKPQEAKYTGTESAPLSSNSEMERVITKDGQYKNIIVANDPSFEPRIVSGGGEKPLGWLISVTETQPKVFTGKLLYRGGIETYDLFIQEQDYFFTGQAKSVKDKLVKEFSMQREDKLCKDSEGNTYEYTLVASFLGSNLSGCGGTVVEVKK
jgi:hypothetical protein